jgi:hypothetical protein
MSANSAERTDKEPEGRPDNAPWARFDDVVEHLIDAPLQRVQEQVTSAARGLGERVDKIEGALTGIQDALEDTHQRLGRVATELGAHVTATAADEQVRSKHRERIARDLAALGETSGQLATQVDTATVAVEHAVSELSAQILRAQDLLQAEQVKELTAQTAALNETLRALHADAEASRQRADARIEAAVADLRDSISKELAAASQQSGQADNAVAARLMRLRLTSYTILAVLIILAAGYLATTLAKLCLPGSCHGESDRGACACRESCPRHATRRYSLIVPLMRAYLRTWYRSRSTGSGSGFSGAAEFRERCGRCWVMAGFVLAQDPAQVGLVPDEGSVQELAPASADPAFGGRVHPGRPDAAQHGPDPASPRTAPKAAA